MQIINIDDLTETNIYHEKLTATIGFFDGVHLGHQTLLKQVEKQVGKKAIITFDRHPSKRPLLTLHEKLNILKTYDIDTCFVIIMNEKNQNIDSEAFIKILKRLNIYKIIVGSDVRFGKDANGNVLDLKYHFEIEVFPFVEDKYGKICSSTIRNLIDKAEFQKVNAMLNRTYKITGIVQKGRQIGRTIDFPTANINTENYIPQNGIYITKTYIGDKAYDSVTNIGYQPTVGGEEVAIETHILDFNDDIYGEIVSVEFKKLIRHEKKFSSLDELKHQIQKDVETTREYYGN